MPSLSRRKLATYVARRLTAGDSKQSVLQELAAYLLETRRTHEADLVIRDTEAALARSGSVVATATSARPLTEESVAHIEAYIAQQYSDSAKVILRQRIDESLIGGVKLDMPGKSLDASVKAKLDKLTV